MPVSHLTLTVSHLPTSTSFYLACLQPLGYQFIGRHDEYIGFGTRPEEPADFWITQEKPGVPVGAVHVAFPARSPDAVNAFFITALKAGGKIHGEPKTRDTNSGYFSAAIIDFDGNSIEAVYRPSSSPDSSQVAGPAFKMIKENSIVNGSTVSRARSTKTESVSMPRSGVKVTASKAPDVKDIPPPAPAQPMYPVYQVQEPSDNGSKAAKTIITTLLGATAGAAIAYAMASEASEPTFVLPTFATPPTAPAPTPAPAAVPMPVPDQPEDRSTYRAIEAAIANSTISHKDTFSRCSRSLPSKARADTIYEGTEYYAPATAAPSVYSTDSAGIRRSSSGSIYATKDLPIRAIEYSPKERSQSYPCNPSTLISSFLNKSLDAESESECTFSTIKSPRSTHSSRVSSYHDKCSHHSSYHTHHSPRSTITIRESQSKPKSRSGDSLHSAFTALKVSGSAASLSAYKSPKSARSPHIIPLPESAAGAGTIFLDTVDVDTHITPDDSVSQVGDARSTRSRQSSHSHRSSKASHTSKRSSKFDDPIKPSDSISQVSTNISKSSERTMRPAGSASGGSRAGSKAPSRVGSKASTQRV